jgi:hypothetical protein
MFSMAVAGLSRDADRVGQPRAADGAGGLVNHVPHGGIMAPHASSVITVSPETGPEQLPVSPGLALAEPPAAGQPGRPRPLEAAQCSLCGITIPLGLLVPDGGPACADIRWYCKDARSCTERWTADRPPTREYTQAVPGTVVAAAGEAVSDAASAEQLDGMLEEAKAAV